MIAAARLPLRSDPANSQFERPSAHGRIWLSGSQTRLPASNPLRTVHASFPAHGSSLCESTFRHPVIHHRHWQIVLPLGSAGGRSQD